MRRPSFNRKERARLFSLYDGCCYLCSGKIQIDQAWEIEHVVPWELTHDNSDDNLRLAHTKCHKIKTANDIRGIRKADRIKAKHDGTYPPSPRPLRSRKSFADQRRGFRQERNPE